MISYIEGKILAKGARHTIILSSGIGYRVFVTNETLEKLGKIGEETRLWTHHAVREDSEELYGFPTEKGVDFFELLLSISGIGPKSALSILGVATIDMLQNAISSGDISYLTKVSGIGTKTANKIVLELKEKIGVLGKGFTMKQDVDAMEALKALGYGQTEIREALKQLTPDVQKTGDKVKAALKILAKS